jgi:hypothetical protein
LESSQTVWLSASIAEGRIVFLPNAKPGPKQPGTLGEQLEVARLAADNPWDFVDRKDAYQAARRTILQHARRPKG